MTYTNIIWIWSELACSKTATQLQDDLHSHYWDWSKFPWFKSGYNTLKDCYSIWHAPITLYAPITLGVTSMPSNRGQPAVVLLLGSNQLPYIGTQYDGLHGWATTSHVQLVTFKGNQLVKYIQLQREYYSSQSLMAYIALRKICVKRLISSPQTFKRLRVTLPRGRSTRLLSLDIYDYHSKVSGMN